jgi:phage replication-related protein YjqB (UPF0714/DUF867 family)
MYHNKQNCKECSHIISVELDNRYGNKWDLYVHTYSSSIELLARHGNNPEDYIACGTNEVSDRKSPNDPLVYLFNYLKSNPNSSADILYKIFNI